MQSSLNSAGSRGDCGRARPRVPTLIPSLNAYSAKARSLIAYARGFNKTLLAGLTLFAIHHRFDGAGFAFRLGK
jgi:hypothetical protein